MNGPENVYSLKPKPLPPVVIDGVIYGGIALMGYLSTQFNTDDAAKFVTAAVLFWMKTGCGASAALLLALKMYRSTAYADHLKQSNGHQTDFFGRTVDNKAEPPKV